MSEYKPKILSNTNILTIAGGVGIEDSVLTPEDIGDITKDPDTDSIGWHGEIPKNSPTNLGPIKLANSTKSFEK